MASVLRRLTSALSRRRAGNPRGYPPAMLAGGRLEGMVGRLNPRKPRGERNSLTNSGASAMQSRNRSAAHVFSRGGPDLSWVTTIVEISFSEKGTFQKKGKPLRSI